PTPSPTLFPYTTLFRSSTRTADFTIRGISSPGAGVDRGLAATVRSAAANLHECGIRFHICDETGGVLGFTRRPDRAPTHVSWPLDRKSTRLNSSHSQIS